MWCPLVYRYYTGFWFREARFDSSVDNKGKPTPIPSLKGGVFNEKASVMGYGQRHKRKLLPHIE